MERNEFDEKNDRVIVDYANVIYHNCGSCEYRNPAVVSRHRNRNQGRRHAIAGFAGFTDTLQWD